MNSKTNKKRFDFPYNKVLILENEFWSEGKDSIFNNFCEKLKTQGVELKIIERAAGQDKKEIVNGLKWCEVLMFSSTFLYEQDVKGLGDLLKNFPIPKTVIGYVNGSRGDLKYYLEKIWELKELAELSHHKVFELTDPYAIAEENETLLTEIDMVSFKTQWDKDEKERIHRNHNMPKTGRKVVIGKILACGPQWSLLKEGDVVDELDCSSIDETPGRGVWVMGKDEPVKLLNDCGYNEFHFEELTARSLTVEFFARGEKKHREDLMETVEVWIYNVSGKIDNTELWEWCDNLCKIIGVERRGNRTYFERRLQEYRSKHKHFKEIGGDPRLKRISAFK